MKKLSKTRYNELLSILADVNINHYFAKAVLKCHAKGHVFVDNELEPSSFYILSDYGMSLLFGNTKNTEFNRQLAEHFLNNKQQRSNDEWLQVYPQDWSLIVEKLCNGRLIKGSDATKHFDSVIQNTRVNFEFDRDKFELSKTASTINDCEQSIRALDKDIFQQLAGKVAPQHFWKNADDFIKFGKGYSLVLDDQVASSAYSACVDNNILEIGIETKQEHQGKGYAFTLASKLIDYCLDNNLTPVWACRLENTGSYLLAQKLGFTPTKELPYYRLCKSF